MEIREIKPTVINIPAFRRVAAYARVSTEKQATLDSLSNQISYYNDYISTHPGWLYAGVYADYGLTGTRTDRPEFQRLLADCRAGKIDIVITKSITRFARNTVTLLSTVRELKELGIEVIFEKENMSSLSEEGDFLLTLLAMFAEEEARSASENVLWRIRKQFEQGEPTHHNLFGYRMIDGQFQIVEEEAAIVRQIFTDYLTGMGVMAIIRKLNSSKSAPGKRTWHPSHIAFILKNEKYTGNMMLQKWFVTDFRTKKKNANLGQRRQYYVEESHEPIISMELFQQVQAEMKRRADQFYFPHHDNPALFTGLIRCGICGSAFSRKLAPTSRNRRLPVWICHAYEAWGRSRCSAKRIREDILIAKTREVLSLTEKDELTREVIKERVQSIEAFAGNVLRYHLADDQVRTVTWENPSRRVVWTPAMREHASQVASAWHQQQKRKVEEGAEDQPSRKKKQEECKNA